MKKDATLARYLHLKEIVEALESAVRTESDDTLGDYYRGGLAQLQGAKERMEVLHGLGRAEPRPRRSRSRRIS